MVIVIHYSRVSENAVFLGKWSSESARRAKHATATVKRCGLQHHSVFRTEGLLGLVKGMRLPAPCPGDDLREVCDERRQRKAGAPLGNWTVPRTKALKEVLDLGKRVCV